MLFRFPKSWVAAVGVMLMVAVALAQDWQKKAVEQYPDLVVAGSPLSKKYRALYHERLRTNPAYFRLPQWPMLLAREAAAQVGAQPSTQTPAAPAAPATDVVASEPPEITAGRKLLISKCGRCHETPNARVDEMTWNRWVWKWRGRANLTDDECQQLAVYAKHVRESPPPAPSATPESPEMAAGKKLFQLKCCGCHDVPSPSRVEEGTWTRWMMKMRGKAKLTDAEYDQIMDYARRAREAYMLKMMR
jgi:cytochrome c5